MDLPRGTVTFLFTDIEGSTRLLRELGEQYPDVLAEHTASCVRRSPVTAGSRLARSTQAATSRGISSVIPLPRSGRSSVIRATRPSRS